MREINFRGKRADNGEWVYGELNCGVFSSNSFIDGIIIPETVGQYIGLKDKNGVDIYEGDVVRNGEFVKYLTGQERHSDDVGVVRYDIKNGCLVINNNNGWTKRLTDKVIKNDRVCVIGNIHDNPELMEVEDENS